MLLLLLLEHLVRRLIFVFLPIPRSEDAPGLFINLALVALLIVGLALSLRRSPKEG
jgi:MYXO-CTERM domain-containing protein